MKTYHLAIITSVILLLPSCATVKETYSPDGEKAYTLNCSGKARGWDKCYSAAGEICKDAGYDIIERNSEDTATSAISGSANRYNANVSGTSIKTNERTMVITCKTKK